MLPNINLAAHMQLDTLDLRILAELQQDSSRSPTWRWRSACT
jgi:hypothetical protein